ncbi:MAG: hypothetical protein WC307_07180 [Candidatus Nanoarchaeia archaeon]|jgi:hypothetical protein
MARNVLRSDGITQEIELGFANAVDRDNNAIRVTDQTRDKLLVDYESGENPIYVAKAKPGTSTSAASWSIMKITWDVNNNPTAIEWADGTNSNDKYWTSRGDYSYS